MAEKGAHKAGVQTVSKFHNRVTIYLAAEFLFSACYLYSNKWKYGKFEELYTAQDSYTLEYTGLSIRKDRKEKKGWEQA